LDYRPYFYLETEFNTCLTDALKLANLTKSLDKVALYNSIKAMIISWRERVHSILVNGTEAEFMKCNKTILVDSNEALQETFIRLSADVLKSEELRTSLTLNIGKDRLFPQQFVFEVPVRRWDGGLLTRRMSSLLSSGIYYQFHKMTQLSLESVFHRREANSQDPIPLNFHTNILSFFIIYLICVLASTFCLVMEYVRFIISLNIELTQNKNFD